MSNKIVILTFTITTIVTMGIILQICIIVGQTSIGLLIVLRAMEEFTKATITVDVPNVIPSILSMTSPAQIVSKLVTGHPLTDMRTTPILLNLTKTILTALSDELSSFESLPKLIKVDIATSTKRFMWSITQMATFTDTPTTSLESNMSFRFAKCIIVIIQYLSVPKSATVTTFSSSFVGYPIRESEEESR